MAKKTKEWLLNATRQIHGLISHQGSPAASQRRPVTCCMRMLASWEVLGIVYELGSALSLGIRKPELICNKRVLDHKISKFLLSPEFSDSVNT